MTDSETVKLTSPASSLLWTVGCGTILFELAIPISVAGELTRTPGCWNRCKAAGSLFQAAKVYALIAHNEKAVELIGE